MGEISRGSKWIKCDLHIHSPASSIQHYGDKGQGATWEKFIVDLENLPSEFKVIGINDYLTIEGYKKVIAEKNKGRLSNIECILPVVEFRLNKFAGESMLKRINYHVIFSDELSSNIIQKQFLDALSASYTLESGQADTDWDSIISDDAFIDLGNRLKTAAPKNVELQKTSSWQVGFNNFNVNYDKLKEILDRPQFRGKTIRAIGKGEWDDYRWDAGGAADKRTIINEADIVFLSCNSVDQYHVSKEKLIRDNVNIRLLDCSDAHYPSSSDQKDRIGNCHTWLKIEPSFNGLKQILLEKDRILISETHPDKKSPYQIIEYINFTNGGDYFTDKKIYLSPELTSIIGGKSTGKSLLAGLIVKSSDPTEYLKRKEKKNNDDLEWVKGKASNLDFEVHWKDGVKTSLNDSTITRKITYFPQHYLNSKINDTDIDNKELNQIIYNILSQTEIYAQAFQEYEEALKHLKIRITTDCNNYESKLKELNQLRNLAQEKGKSSDIQNTIDQLNAELSDLKGKYDLSEEELQSHKELSSVSEDLENQKKITTDSVCLLASLNEEEITHRIQADKLSEVILEKLLFLLPPEVVQLYKAKISSFVSDIVQVSSIVLHDQKELIKNISNQIEENRNKHQSLLEKISKSTPLKEKSDLIKQENIKLDESKKIEEKIKSINTEINDISNRLVNYIGKTTDSTKLVTSKIEEQPFAKSDLGISISHRCKATHIQGILKDRIKYQKNSKIKSFVSDDTFNDKDIGSYLNIFSILLEQSKDGSLDLKGENRISSILQDLLSDAIYLNYNLTLAGDSFNTMSPGKRSLVLMQVLVELDISQYPIVLDQPEDDLDNRSVYEGLVQYLKDKKSRRQIIVVTHNPNIVVGADSEHIIVANQSGQEANQDNRKYRFEYIYGGLENSFIDLSNNYVLEQKGIREHVCEILDGGKEAFKRREQLYSGKR